MEKHTHAAPDPVAEAIRFQGAGVRITDSTIETPLKSYPLADALALEERRFFGAELALVMSFAFMVLIVAVLGGTELGRDWIFYVFVAVWSGLVALLAYAAVALKGLRIRTAGKTIPLGRRFTPGERRRIIAAFAEAKAALAD